MNAAEFLHALFGHFDDGHLTLFHIDANGNKATEWFSVHELDRMAQRATSLDRHNVWFGVATRKEQLPDGRRGGADDCAAIPALWADIDIAGDNHASNDGLPANLDAANQLLANFPLRPSIVVKTGGGLHPYWLFSEPVDAAEAMTLLERWATTWARLAEQHGLRTDNVFDLPRVLRVPGTYNIKKGAHQPIEVTETSGLLYSTSDIVENTDEPPVKAHRSTTRGPVIGLRPGDEYNQRHSGGDVLAAAGWTLGKTARNGDESWLHPWAPSSDASATVYDDGHTAIWSDTAVARTQLEKNHSYDPFGLYAALFHDGDHAAASKQLAAEGYGQRPSNVEIIVEDDGTIRRGKRSIQTNNRSLDDTTNEVVAELQELNEPPSLFRHGDIVSQFDRGQLDPVDRTRLLHVVETSMSPVVVNKDGTAKPARFDAQSLDLTLYRLTSALPEIEGIVHAPFFRADGTVCVDVGYDPVSRLYLASTLPIRVPDQPTGEDISRAVAVVDDMICDFPLDSPADRAYIFALLLTMLTRHLVPLTPLFAFDGNGPGVGKNLLSECCIYIATGEWIQTDPLPLDAEEQRKQITALLSTGRSVALFDEAHTISGVSLARLITSTTWGDRLLGYSRQVSYPNRLTVVALGNNIEVQGDMPRRTILIRLASELSRPELRQGFRHDDLRAWVTNHRADVLQALLVLLRAWSAAGSPPGRQRLGSFDAWAQMIGGVLDHAGIAGFLANAAEMRQRAATDDTDMADHLAEIHSQFGGFEFTTGEAARLLVDGKVETWPPKVGDNERRLAKRLGEVYRRSVGRWYGDLQIVPGDIDRVGARRWSVTVRDAKPQENAGTAGTAGTDYSLRTKSSDQKDRGPRATTSPERKEVPAVPAVPADEPADTEPPDDPPEPPRRRPTADDIGL